MKQTKKLFSIVLAIALVFAMAIPAFAAEQTGNIVINSAANVSVDGKVFNAYKILDAEAVAVDNLDAGIVYTIPTEMQSFYNTLCGGDDNTATVAEVEAYIKGLSADELLAFAKNALAAAKAAGVTAEEATGADNKATFTNIPFGYYVIEDTTSASADGAVVSAVMLDTTNAVELTLKADKPAIEKKIDGDNDADTETSGLVDYNTAKVGDEVPYVLTSKVPDMTGYTSYTYVVTDTLSAGLTFNNDVEITVGDKTLTADDFTVTQADQVVTIEFKNFISYTKGADITIKYSATVNENAVVGVEGNPNAVDLEYSNNPQDTTSTDTTPDDITRTYLVNLVIEKTDGKGNALAGATFQVTDKEGNVIGTATTTDGEGGNILTFTGLKDGGEYTITETVVPDGYNKAADITFTVDCTYPEADAASQNCTWTSDDESVKFVATEGTADDYFKTSIQNLTGSLLPETGGMGTTMFYMIGAMMVAAAVVLFVSKKRMAFEA